METAAKEEVVKEEEKGSKHVSCISLCSKTGPRRERVDPLVASSLSLRLDGR